MPGWRGAGVDADPGPVVVAGALGALASRYPLPGAAGQAAGDRVGALAAGGGGDVVAAGDGQHVPGAAGLQFGSQARVSAVDRRR